MQEGWTSTEPGGRAPTLTITIALDETQLAAFGNTRVLLPSTSTNLGDDGRALSLLLVATGAWTVVGRRMRIPMIAS